MIPHPDEMQAFDPAIQTEDIAFKPGEMLICDGCNRSNPPNRLHCIYCGQGLEIEGGAAAGVKPNFRKLETFERGFNVILMNAAGAEAAKVASLLSCERAMVQKILDAGVPLPLARVGSDRDAAFLESRLSEMGIKTVIVADADLASESPPVRLSKIDLGDDAIDLTDFNTGKRVSLSKQDLVLLVRGPVTQSRVDSLEKKRRRGKAKKILDESATVSDGAVLDLYSRADSTGFRVHLTGFDFSCLGENKGLLAADNLRRLMGLLASTCPNAKLVESYGPAREALGHVWEIESRNDPKGLLHIGFGKHEFGSVASTSNLAQFTKYSRLQWHLI